MNCLCCGKPISETASPEERTSEWHRACVRKFFGTSVLPEVMITDDSFYMLAVEAAANGLTVPGVQKKLSLHLTRRGAQRSAASGQNYPDRTDPAQPASGQNSIEQNRTGMYSSGLTSPGLADRRLNISGLTDTTANIQAQTAPDLSIIGLNAPTQTASTQNLSNQYFPAQPALRHTPPRLTQAGYPTGYIMKPQLDVVPHLPEWEYLSMQMARATGIRTVPFALIRTDPDGTLAYITKRIDRIIPARKNQETECFGMEDFCQLKGLLTEEKYLGSYEECAAVISRYSVNPGLDLSELFLRLVFFFVSGNSDMHLKNFSLIETAPGSSDYVLSPAYDMLSTNMIVPGDTEQLALTINGKKKDLHREDFISYAKAVSLPEKAAVRLIEKVISMKGKYLELCGNAPLTQTAKDRFAALLESRIRDLKAVPAGDSGTGMNSEFISIPLVGSYTAASANNNVAGSRNPEPGRDSGTAGNPESARSPMSGNYTAESANNSMAGNYTKSARNSGTAGNPESARSPMSGNYTAESARGSMHGNYTDSFRPPIAGDQFESTGKPEPTRYPEPAGNSGPAKIPGSFNNSNLAIIPGSSNNSGPARISEPAQDHNPAANPEPQKYPELFPL